VPALGAAHDDARGSALADALMNDEALVLPGKFVTTRTLKASLLIVGHRVIVVADDPPRNTVFSG